MEKRKVGEDKERHHPVILCTMVASIQENLKENMRCNMISIYRFAIADKPNTERESRVYGYFETYMDNLECLGSTKSRAALDGIIGKFVLDFEPLQNDDIIGIAIMDEENLIDFLYETESGTLRWSTDHFDAQEYLAKELA